MIELYDINAIAIKKLHPSRRSKNLFILASKIKELAKQNKMKIIAHSIKEIEKLLITAQKQNKWNLIDAIVRLYPELYFNRKIERSHKNRYHVRMFEAVALASVFTQNTLFV
jgi:hypothetical protein